MAFMTVEAVILLAVLVGMAYLFLTEKFPVDLTALGGLGLLLVLGYLAPEQAFSGFSSPAIITMLATFIVGIALERTGITD